LEQEIIKLILETPEVGGASLRIVIVLAITQNKVWGKSPKTAAFTDGKFHRIPSTIDE
jgi:hypothetical protein